MITELCAWKSTVAQQTLNRCSHIVIKPERLVVHCAIDKAADYIYHAEPSCSISGSSTDGDAVKF
jgi:hypothetical protein